MSIGNYTRFILKFIFHIQTTRSNAAYLFAGFSALNLYTRIERYMSEMQERERCIQTHMCTHMYRENFYDDEQYFDAF